MTTTITTDISAINTAFDNAFNNKNIQGIVNLYGPDAHVMPAPAGEVVSGRAAIETFFLSLITAGVIDHKLTLTEAVADGNLAYQRGQWSGALVDEQGLRQTFGGNVHLVYRKQTDGTWLAVTHIWN